MKRRDAILRFAAAGAALALPAARADAGRIVLGQSAAFSGPASALGEQFKKGALLLFDRVNAHGGIGGRTIELQSLDDGYEPDRCTANTKKLIDSGVFALFGYIGTPTSLAALPLATAARMPFVGPFTGAEARIEGYVAARALVEGLRRAGSRLSADTLIAGLESLHDLNLGGFFVDFGAQKHTGSRFVDLTILSADGRVRH